MPLQQINWAIYHSLPPEEAQYQLAHIHESKTDQVAISYFICLPIAVIAIIMRFLSRRIGGTAYGADDWVIVVALIITLGFSPAALLAIFRYGGGRHTILMTETDPMNFAKTSIAGEVLYAPAIGAVKISTLLLFARIFPGRKFRRVLWAIGLFVSTYTAMMIIIAVFHCSPIKGAWDPTIQAKCIQIKLFYIIMGGMNILTDVMLLCAPMPELWKLQMRMAAKLQLIGIFSIGSIVTVFSIYRMPKLQSISLLDPAWDDIDALIWSVAEVSVAILCASAITYRPLFNWVFRVRHLSFKVRRSNVAKSPSREYTSTGLKSSDIVGVEMQPPRPFGNESKSRLVENGDRFYRIDDSASV